MESIEWQTWAAIAIVALTIIAFGRNLFGKKKPKGQCGGGCGCAKKPH
ncbi:MAG: FeoB-associated Cys-rich membrane protein [Verrucomicrobiales bacterium]|nr:FeoB-associated Cys-rich membrane protein [Verrucomicrobiales bacterium]